MANGQLIQPLLVADLHRQRLLIGHQPLRYAKVKMLLEDLLRWETLAILLHHLSAFIRIGEH
jgi:hypothetical protein